MSETRRSMQPLEEATAPVEATQETAGGGNEQFHDDHFKCTTDSYGIRAGIEGFRRSRNDGRRLRQSIVT